MGGNTNFFGNEKLEQSALSMKTAADAIGWIHHIFKNSHLGCRDQGESH
jgi:hypothetical protein